MLRSTIPYAIPGTSYLLIPSQIQTCHRLHVMWAAELKFETRLFFKCIKIVYTFCFRWLFPFLRYYNTHITITSVSAVCGPVSTEPSKYINGKIYIDCQLPKCYLNILFTQDCSFLVGLREVLALMLCQW